MLGFFVTCKGCQVIPETSINSNLKEIIENIPYSQKQCSICLELFLNDYKLPYYDLSKNCLNMEWFRSRLLILKCNHVFHLCCFTKRIKHQYESYMFSQFEININDEIENNIDNTGNTIDSCFMPLQESLVLRIDEQTNITNLSELSDDVCKDLSIYSESDIEIDILDKETIEEITDIISKSENIKTNSEYYQSENDTTTTNNKYKSFRMECPMCKDKLNGFDAQSILEKYKILLELYS